MNPQIIVEAEIQLDIPYNLMKFLVPGLSYTQLSYWSKVSHGDHQKKPQVFLPKNIDYWWQYSVFEDNNYKLFESGEVELGTHIEPMCYTVLNIVFNTGRYSACYQREKTPSSQNTHKYKHTEH